MFGIGSTRCSFIDAAGNTCDKKRLEPKNLHLPQRSWRLIIHICCKYYIGNRAKYRMGLIFKKTHYLFRKYCVRMVKFPNRILSERESHIIERRPNGKVFEYVLNAKATDSEASEQNGKNSEIKPRPHLTQDVDKIVKWLEPGHAATDCVKAPTIAPICVNCNGLHSTNYRDSPARNTPQSNKPKPPTTFRAPKVIPKKSFAQAAASLWQPATAASTTNYHSSTSHLVGIVRHLTPQDDGAKMQLLLTVLKAFFQW